MLLSGAGFSPPGTGFFCASLLGGCGGTGGGTGLFCGTGGGWLCLECWLSASMTLAVFATGSGGGFVAVDVTRIGGTGGWIAGGSDEDLCLLPLSCPIAWDFQARAFEWALCILLPKKS